MAMNNIVLPSSEVRNSRLRLPRNMVLLFKDYSMNSIMVFNKWPQQYRMQLMRAITYVYTENFTVALNVTQPIQF